MDQSKAVGWKKSYFLIWSGQAFSLFGSELAQFSLVWYLTRQTGSAAVLATASFVALLPRVFLAPFVGALVDRWNRQRIMIIADATIALLSMLLAGIFWAGAIQVWHIYALMFLRSVGTGFHWPAMQASTSLLVPKKHLARVSGINQMLHGALGILAPLAAALLLEWLPMHAILSIDVISAMIAISTLFLVVIPQPEVQARTLLSGASGLWQDVRAGFQYLMRWRGMLILVIGATALNFLLNPGFTFTPLLVTQHFERGVLELSLIEAVFGLGMIAGGLLLGIWGGFKRQVITILSGVLGMAVGTSLVALARADQFVLAVVGMALTGFMMPITNGPLYAILQTNVDAHMQGRVFTLMESMLSAMLPLSMLTAAPVAEWIGIRGWLGLGAAGCFILGASGFFIPALMLVEERGAELKSSTLQQEPEQDESGRNP